MTTHRRFVHVLSSPWALIWLITVLCTTAVPATTRAATIVDLDAGGGVGNGHLSPRFPEDMTAVFFVPGFRYRVNLDPLVGKGGVAALAPPTDAVGKAPADADLLALRAEFPGWNFTPGGAAPGNFNLVQYDVDIDRDLPNRFLVNYVPPAAGPPGAAGDTIHWIQIIHTNDPCKPGLPNPYVDPQCVVGAAPGMRDDALPFYWTLAEVGAHRAAVGGGGIRFQDRPGRPLVDALRLPGGVEWEAHLFLATWNNDAVTGDGTPPAVTIYDGVRWGFEIRCISAGLGPNRRGGVSGDKEVSEEQGSASGPIDPPTVCLSPAVSVPGPSMAVAFLLGSLGLVVCSRRVRGGYPPAGGGGG